MTYQLSPEEFQTIQAQDAEQRYHHFLQQAVTQGEIWILKDQEGCVSLSADDEDCIPVWPHPDYARAWAGDEFADCETYAVPLKTWLDRWVKGMHEDGVAVAVFPLADADGVVEDPETVADDLLRKMAKLNRKK
ncbi:MAG: DUF2750 domain-containing protein [Gammaproteobacteria bacterium]|uniref:DUF2750 domain-containing protein n=1 Tax=Tolumonas osonensis TaxID=675874 RepID=A0A841GQH6_9GAMM|nr:DUF2750 domain-containing protein [Tolumonas osonensis]MBB6056822.1 hypothetical protein [Tolumonas osonensis]NCB58792.1 DUF2750 domain-containing protein [Gammaproteobacteria bacterium]